ncbi:alpha/beta hydrolase [Pontiellaceae bacterium B12227]|nr:alpha/beta hydrolase [Pontiellaceae bacterium B12227]
MQLKHITSVLLYPLMLCGCTMWNLKGDLKNYERHNEISGTVVCEEVLEETVIVVLWSRDEGGLSSYWLTRCNTDFSFLRDAGEYYLMAFADTNEDGRYQETEWGGIFDDGQVVDPLSGKDYTGLTLRLLPPGEIALPEDVILTPHDEALEKFALRKSQAGEGTALNNALFSDEIGAMGLWTPLKFAREVGVKLYFLEEYDARKTPVLFIHGAGGHPGVWASIIENLDRERYQPWLAFYPSGFRLEQLGGYYVQLLDELHHTYGFSEMHVIAHSMGGLVGRSMLLQYAGLEGRPKIPVFISIATPWQGHAASKVGIKYAVAVVPSWLDMVPGCRFQQHLYAQSLPDETKHYLLFAYEGKSSVIPGHVNNDGTVTLQSQLYDPAQTAAERVIGIDANHASIMSDPGTHTWINLFLKN